MIIDKSDFYKLQALSSLMSSVCFFYEDEFLSGIIFKKENFDEYLYFLDQILDCNCVLTKQLRILILGHVVLLNNENFFAHKNEEYLEILRITFDLLNKQKSEESEKLKKELVNETDCNFLEEDENDDTDGPK